MLIRIWRKKNCPIFLLFFLLHIRWCFGSHAKRWMQTEKCGTIKCCAVAYISVAWSHCCLNINNVDLCMQARQGKARCWLVPNSEVSVSMVDVYSKFYTADITPFLWLFRIHRYSQQKKNRMRLKYQKIRRYVYWKNQSIPICPQM